MKIFVVTNGGYWDYHIERVFLDEDKANEFAKWCSDDPNVEEYDTDDNAYGKYHIIRIDVNVWSGGMDIRHQLRVGTQKETYTGYMTDPCYAIKSTDASPMFTLRLTRSVEDANWDEELWVDKYEKVATDIAHQVEAMIARGVSERDINSMLFHKQKSEVSPE